MFPHLHHTTITILPPAMSFFFLTFESLNIEKVNIKFGVCKHQNLIKTDKIYDYEYSQPVNIDGIDICAD